MYIVYKINNKNKFLRNYFKYLIKNQNKHRDIDDETKNFHLNKLYYFSLIIEIWAEHLP